MASTGTFGQPGWQYCFDSSISNPTIDNTSYVYWVEVELNGSAGGNLQAGRIIVEYTYSSAGG